MSPEMKDLTMVNGNWWPGLLSSMLLVFESKTLSSPEWLPAAIWEESPRNVMQVSNTPVSSLHVRHGRNLLYTNWRSRRLPWMPPYMFLNSRVLRRAVMFDGASRLRFDSGQTCGWRRESGGRVVIGAGHWRCWCFK